MGGADAGQAFGLAFMWAFCGLIGAIPTIVLLKWWSEGEIAGLEALGLIAFYVLLFVLLMGPAPPAVKAMLAVLIAGTSGTILYAATIGQRRSASSFEHEKEALFRQAINSNPSNCAARSELARLLHRNGRLSEAIEEIEAAIRISPSVAEPEQRMLDQWIAERDGSRAAVTICRWCREANPTDRPVCATCGRPTGALREVRDAVLADAPTAVRRAVLVLPLLLVLSFLLSALPGLLQLLVMSILVLVGCWWVLRRVDQI